MARVGAVILGVGLVVLWIVGMNHTATAWLTWMNGIAGLVSFVVAALAPSEEGRASAGGPGVIGFALVGFWIIALATHATEWLSWWTFGFGCAYIIVAMASTSPVPRLRHHTP
jgi:hypothetical protein